MICTVSLVACSGAVNRIPCQPSITCGPLTPSPSRNRPPDSACSDSADMASSAGLRAPIWAMPDPSRIRLVCAARNASGVSASWPQASAVHAEAAPRASASRTRRAVSGGAPSMPSATVSGRATGGCP